MDPSTVIRTAPTEGTHNSLAPSFKRNYRVKVAQHLGLSLFFFLVSLAMRVFMRSRHVERRENDEVLLAAGLTRAQVEDMYKIMALAAYEDRFVIPTSHREYAENAYDLRGSCGFSFGNGCSDGQSEFSLFGMKKYRGHTQTEVM